MNNQIEIGEHSDDGWAVFVPATQTVPLLAFLRHKTTFSIDMEAISGVRSEQETDIFTIDDKEDTVRMLVSDFTKQQN
jgi:hypothetical protein